MKLVHYFQQYSKIPGVVMKMGPNGVIVGADGKTRHYPAIPLIRPLVSVSGAGDSLAAGTIWSLVAPQATNPKTNSNTNTNTNTNTNVNMQQPSPSLHTAIGYGLAAARMSLESTATVNPLLHATTLHQIVQESKLKL